MSVRICDFGTTMDGAAVQQAVLKNERIEVRVLSYAAILSHILVPDRSGTPVDVALGYAAVPDYERSDDGMGAAIGRFANRIGGARFMLDGRVVYLTANEKGNCLHSGLHGLNHTLFTMDVTPGRADSVTLTALCPDGVDGFAGNVRVWIQYTLAGCGLMIRYHAESDAPTVCNLTNHSYFNLNGHASGSVLGHRLRLDANAYLETDGASIPTGHVIPVAGTPMDFTAEKALGRDIDTPYPALVQGQGYDHCYVVPGSGLRHFAWLTSPETGIRMEVLSTLPAVQLYTANFLDPAGPCKEGAAYQKRGAVCLETQDYPDAPNHPTFPDTTLRPGAPYSATTIYRFDAAPQ